MVVIRLSRYGVKKAAKYRITVADQRRWRNSRVIDILGQYIPSHKGAEKRIVLDLKKAEKWVSQGAKPSLRVQKLISQQKQILKNEKSPVRTIKNIKKESQITKN